MFAKIFKKILHKLKLWYYLPSNMELIKQVMQDNMQIKRKLSMLDSVWYNNNTSFYVPNYPLDPIQNDIVDKGTYFEIEILKELKDILTPPPPIIKKRSQIKRGYTF
ncbi:hypothetical protein [Helicobacter cetorum]|uniref:Uncharacterized protein n=1 Tax=Helicobacter cetorum (strain ATCC BAA-429 / MIT 00-7128) TaxID=182217 RepID=I0EPD3_HELC0|nr:hypothetical protein [Helicobacter cetorum]AFI04802.1 hypothetical protein HCW_07720 [Helicobacter cetorum MIT 00-7128]